MYTLFTKMKKLRPPGSLHKVRRGWPIGLLAVAGVLVGALWWSGLTLAQSSGDFRLEKSVIDGGSWRMSSSSFGLWGTAGQKEAGTSTLSSSSYVLQGGFWAGTAPEATSTPTPTPTQPPPSTPTATPEPDPDATPTATPESDPDATPTSAPTTEPDPDATPTTTPTSEPDPDVSPTPTPTQDAGGVDDPDATPTPEPAPLPDLFLPDVGA